MTFLSTLSAVCAAIIAMGGAGAVLSRVPFIRKRWDLYRNAVKTGEHEALRADVRLILAEFVPNGGASFKDQMNRVEAHVKTLDKGMMQVHTRLNRLERR